VTRLDWPRTLIAFCVIASMTGLMASGVVMADAGVPVIATVLGYVFGSAAATLNGKLNDKLNGKQRKVGGERNE
jgi:hypothetical protein